MHVFKWLAFTLSGVIASTGGYISLRKRNHITSSSAKETNKNPSSKSIPKSEKPTGGLGIKLKSLLKK